MNSYDFQQVRNATDLERATHAVFDEAYDAWTDEGRELLTEGQLTVLAVETYFGEVLNGGFWQYFSNQSGALANFAPAALRRVGLNKYADVLDSFLVLFPKGTVSEDATTRHEQITGLDEQYGEEYLEQLERPFWDLYDNADEFRQKLFDYIVANEAEFVSK
jgi:hypothetical protein